MLCIGISIVPGFLAEYDMTISPAYRIANRVSGIIVIPARLPSSRLPRKLMLNDTGQPLLAYTIEQAQSAVAASQGLLREVIVACDDEQLIEVAEASGVRGVMTRDSHPNGTCRIAEAIQKIANTDDISFVLNVQGDQPELQPEAMQQVVADLIDHSDCDMATAAVEYQKSELPGERLFRDCSIADPNVVKVEFDSSGHATDFWRQLTATNNRLLKTAPDRWYRHIGIYAYRTHFLQRFLATPPSQREQQESLEQLRALEMGAVIRVSLITAERAGRAIDSPADYADFAERMRQRKAASQ